MKLRSMGVLLLLAVAMTITALPGSASAAKNTAPATKNSASAATNQGFVTRSGSRLELDGKPFRFSGANIEWLGLIGYGPHNWTPGDTEQYPSDYEINDALATAKGMGATVVVSRRIRLDLGTQERVAPAIRDRGEPTAQVGPDRTAAAGRYSSSRSRARSARAASGC